MKPVAITGTPVWVTIRAESGIISDARVFTNEADAMRLHDHWRYHEDYNEDYDEVDVVEARVETGLDDPARPGPCDRSSSEL